MDPDPDPAIRIWIWNPGWSMSYISACTVRAEGPALMDDQPNAPLSNKPIDSWLA